MGNVRLVNPWKDSLKVDVSKPTTSREGQNRGTEQRRISYSRSSAEGENRRNRENKRTISGYSKAKKSYRGSKRIRKAILPFLLAGAVAIGGIAGCVAINNNGEGNKPITIEQIADENPDLLETLGVDKDTVDTLRALQIQLENEDISDSELKDVGEQIEDLQLAVVKTKLSQILGVDTSRIKVGVNYDKYDGDTTYIEIDDEIAYRNDDISPEISDYIKEIADTQTVNNTVADGEFDREGAIDQYREALDETNEFAAGMMRVESIELEQGKQKDLNEYIYDLEEIQENNDEGR